MATFDFFRKKCNVPKDNRVSADVLSVNVDDGVEIIAATTASPAAVKKPDITPSTTPKSKTKKRTLKSGTVDKWIKNDLARHNAELWLKYDADHDGNVDALRCALCTDFEEDLRYMKDFSTAWITGSRNLKLSNAKDHAETLCHAKAFRLHSKKVRRDTGIECSVTLPDRLVDQKQPTLPQACQTLSIIQQQQLTKKFEIAYMIAKKEMPFTAYEDILTMERHHGVDTGTAYTNRFQCAEFIDCHAEYIADNLKRDLVKAKFFSVLTDGSTDCSITEKEVVYVLYFDPVGDPDKVQVKLTFLYLKDVGVANAPGIQSAIEDSFLSLGILPSQMYEKLVGFGADGASVNSGDKAGVKALLAQKAPWLIFQWCVAHRLELALKDALKDGYFKTVDHMLMRMFYLYHKSPKKLFELKLLHEVMKNTIEFEEGSLKPKRACGTRWISFKLSALKLVYDKFGVYMAHLKQLSGKVIEIATYLKKWNTPHMLLQVAFFIDVLSPVAALSKVYQGEGIDIVGAGEALGKTRAKLAKLEKKKLDDMPTMKSCLQKVQHINGKTVYQGVEFSRSQFDYSLGVLRGKKSAVIDAVVSCIASRLDAGSDPLIEKVSMVLNSESWLARCKVLSNDDDGDEGFADDEVRSVFEHFRPLLKNAGVDCSDVELIDEWHDMVAYTIKFLKPERHHYLKTWKFIFQSSNASRWKNVLVFVELLFSIPVSNAKLERLFSRLKRTKVDCRGSLSEQRLTNLLRIGEEGPAVEAFSDVTPVVKLWSEKKTRRPNQGTKRKLYLPDQENKRRCVSEPSGLIDMELSSDSDGDMSDVELHVEDDEFWNDHFISDSDDENDFDGF